MAKNLKNVFSLIFRFFSESFMKMFLVKSLKSAVSLLHYDGACLQPFCIKRPKNFLKSGVLVAGISANKFGLLATQR